MDRRSFKKIISIIALTLLINPNLTVYATKKTNGEVIIKDKTQLPNLFYNPKDVPSSGSEIEAIINRNLQKYNAGVWDTSGSVNPRKGQYKDPSSKTDPTYKIEDSSLPRNNLKNFLADDGKRVCPVPVNGVFAPHKDYGFGAYRKEGPHRGQDIRFIGRDDKSADRGIRSFTNGKVMWAGKSEEGTYGNMVVISDRDSPLTDRMWHIAEDGATFYLYAHMESVSVTKGQYVKAGDIIGIVGHTGFTISSGGTGTHLHFEINKNATGGKGTRRDPRPELIGPCQLK